MPNLKIYSTPHCPYCKVAKAYFEKNNIQFSEINVEGNEEALNEMIEKSGQMEVPVFVIDEQIIAGFKKGEIDKLLGIKKPEQNN